MKKPFISIMEALCIVNAGWRTDEEKIIYDHAKDRIQDLVDDIYVRHEAKEASNEEKKEVYTVFCSGIDEGIEGLIQLSNDFDDLKAAERYCKSFKSKNPVIYKRV